MNNRASIESFETLDSLFDYHPETGNLTWKDPAPKGKQVKAGRVAGTVVRPKGKENLNYRKVAIDRIDFKAHRICWILYTKKQIPKGMLIDHINGDATDNRIDNLRMVNNHQNTMNSKKPKSNTSGFKGVSLTGSGKYRAYICVNRKQIHLGSFGSPEEAHAEYLKAAKNHFGEYAALDR